MIKKMLLLAKVIFTEVASSKYDYVRSRSAIFRVFDKYILNKNIEFAIDTVFCISFVTIFFFFMTKLTIHKLGKAADYYLDRVHIQF